MTDVAAFLADFSDVLDPYNNAVITIRAGRVEHVETYPTLIEAIAALAFVVDPLDALVTLEVDGVSGVFIGREPPVIPNPDYVATGSDS